MEGKVLINFVRNIRAKGSSEDRRGVNYIDDYGLDPGRGIPGDAPVPKIMISCTGYSLVVDAIGWQ